MARIPQGFVPFVLKDHVIIRNEAIANCANPLCIVCDCLCQITKKQVILNLFQEPTGKVFRMKYT
jgi:hypothetical protein